MKCILIYEISMTDPCFVCLFLVKKKKVTLWFYSVRKIALLQPSVAEKSSWVIPG